MRIPLSHSRIETFDSCPYYFKRRVIDKVPEPPSRPLAVGGFLHSWVERYINHVCQYTPPGGSEYTAGERIFGQLWKMRTTMKGLDILPESDYDELFAIAQSFMESHIFNQNGDKTVGVELELAFNEAWQPVGWYADDVFFRAKIDYVYTNADGQLCIDDWKSDMAVDSLDEVRKNVQLKRYVMAMNLRQAAEAGDELAIPETYQVCLDFIRYQIRRRVTVDSASGEAEKARVMAVSDRIEAARANDSWPATPGAKCDFCPVFSECPAREMATKLRAPQGEAEAQALLQRLIVVEREGGDLKKLLRQYTSQYGTVVTNDMQFGPSKRNVYRYPDSLAGVKWAESHNVPGGSVLKIDNEAMEKICKVKDKAERDRLFAELDEIRVNEGGTEFRLKKATEQA